MVKSAIRTDFILSAEIMVISLNEVADEGLVSRAVILVVVAIGITLLVYGVVGLIVKMDDVDASLRAQLRHGPQGRLAAGPRDAQAVGGAVHGRSGGDAVGRGRILLGGSDELGWHTPYALVHAAEQAVANAVTVLGGLLAWFVNTLASP